MRAIDARGLSRRFEQTRAVDRVDIELEPGDVRGLLGPNGAGKTTLLRILLGLVRPDAGEVELFGRALDDPRRLDGVAGFVEEPSFYPYLSARANLEVLAELDGANSRAQIDVVLAQVELAARAEDRVGGFSSGMRKRLGIAAALMRKPRLLLLDEPTSGLDPAGVRFVGELVRSLAGEGVAVLLSSHQISEVEGVCDSYSVLSSGRLVWSGSAARMLSEAPPSAHRLTTSDDRRALAIGAKAQDARIFESKDGGLTVEASADALDAVVLALGRAGVAVRRLELAQAPLESMFFALVEQRSPDRASAADERSPDPVTRS
ncbi:MAG TPA: ABC transporter ATP-binding protein [Solirubrobacteraceae bacterium]|nr:ABC transporter ATP-binding protein [Solirubrobacteraceae bacterium]